MFLAIVIPAFNEECRLAFTLRRLQEYLVNQRYDYEVILVDDGSSDNTVGIARDSLLFKQGKLKVIENHANRGKGFSVRRGILASSAEYILFSDADLSAPIEEFEKLYLAIQFGSDIAIGSRSIKGAEIRRHQPFYRELMGKLFNKLVRIFVLKGLVDTQCGFKLFRGEVVRRLVGLLVIDGFAFDVEVLYLARRLGYRIKEVGVVWVNSASSKVNAVRDSLKMLWELLTIRKLHRED
jgi:dolichyl-phosphate beta-glucosyltransferase